MGRNRRKKESGFFGNNYWQSSAFNQRVFAKNLDWIESLAINRFRWVGLPKSCDPRFLEQTLLRYGMATICHEKNMPDAWLTLQAAQTGRYNMYGVPVEWQAMGYDGVTNFGCTEDNGVIVYDTSSRVPNWNAMEIYARKLTHYERTEDINLTHQQTPWVLTAPSEKKQELVNFYKQVAGGEPAILGDDSLRQAITVNAVKTDVEFIVPTLNVAKQNLWSEIYRFLGIEHLAFEKGERMIQEEARGNAAPTTIKLMDSLTARRKACDELNQRFGLNVEVFFNDDWESYNFNYENDMTQQKEGAE